jgi:hypothetical protein
MLLALPQSRAFWRSPVDPAQIKYDRAARFGGLAMTIDCALTLPFAGIYPHLAHWPHVVVVAIIALAVSLWVGIGYAQF